MMRFGNVFELQVFAEHLTIDSRKHQRKSCYDGGAGTVDTYIYLLGNSGQFSRRSPATGSYSSNAFLSFLNLVSYAFPSLSIFYLPPAKCDLCTLKNKTLDYFISDSKQETIFFILILSIQIMLQVL